MKTTYQVCPDLASNFYLAIPSAREFRLNMHRLSLPDVSLVLILVDFAFHTKPVFDVPTTPDG